MTYRKIGILLKSIEIWKMSKIGIGNVKDEDAEIENMARVKYKECEPTLVNYKQWEHGFRQV